jgi:hypothetical protein
MRNTAVLSLCCSKMASYQTCFSQFLNSDAPEVARRMPAEPKQKTSMLPSMMGVGTLCLVAIAAKSAGLMSVVRFVTTREGWEAQKSQFSAVTSEWEQMSSTTKAKIEQFRQEEVQAEQKRVAAEKELEDVLKKTGDSPRVFGFTRRRFRPFRAWVVSGTPISGRRFALPWAITLRSVGAKDHLTGKNWGQSRSFCVFNLLGPKRSFLAGLVKSPNRLRWLAHG